MITKKDILKMVAHVAKRGGNIPDRKLIHPEREWALGLVAVLLFLLAGFIYNAQRFSYFNSIEAHLTESSPGTVKYNHAARDEVLQYYDERTVKFQQLRNGIEPTQSEPVSFTTPVNNEEATSTSSESVSTSSDSGTEDVSVPATTDPVFE